MAAENPKLAVLIDADNTPASIVNGLFDEIAKFGEASVRRIYGDFTSSQLRRWQDVLLAHAINPTQQFAYTKGKNASDITLVIEAMDLLNGGMVDGFCLVSSDSDFTRLASRIREQGLVVYGFGAEKTPEAFVKACTRFIRIENLGPVEPVGEAPPPPVRTRRGRAAPKTAAAQAPAPAPAPVPVATSAAAMAPPVPVASSAPVVTIPSSVMMPILRQPDDEPLLDAAAPAPREPPSAAVPLILKAMNKAEDDDGWYRLGNLGNVLIKLFPDFDPRTYGSAKLSALLTRTGAFQTRQTADRAVEVARKDRK